MTTLAELARRLKPRVPQPSLPPLILMTDRHRLPNPMPVVETLARGDAVILRHYGAPEREALAFRLSSVCLERGLHLLIAEDFRLAVRVGAHGLHLPEAQIPKPSHAWRTHHRREWLVTAAAHSPGAITRASEAGIHAVLLSPVFATKSHPNVAPIGPLRFAAWVRESPLPVYALGGVSVESARRLASSGAVGFAGIGGFAPGP